MDLDNNFKFATSSNLRNHVWTTKSVMMFFAFLFIRVGVFEVDNVAVEQPWMLYFEHNTEIDLDISSSELDNVISYLNAAQNQG